MRVRSLLFAAPFVWAACTTTHNSKSQVLTSVTPLATGSTQCPNGGVSITSGVDTNGNGVLDASEVTSTQNICAGTTSTTKQGASSLVLTTTLPVGNSHCEDGGVEIQSGLDNGAGGGTAGDGVLQPGEVTSTQYVCAGTPTVFPATQPPTTAPGNYTIDVSGGAGAAGNGGAGGVIGGVAEAGTNGGGVSFFPNGGFTASFDAPTFTFTPGTTPVVLPAGTTNLVVYTDQTAATTAAPTAPYLVNGDSMLYLLVAGTPTMVDTLDIPSGSTLVLLENNGSECDLSVTTAIRNGGTITLPVDGGSAVLSATSFYGLAMSNIRSTPTSVADAGSLTINVSGLFSNAGDVTLAGADSDATGGEGGNYAINQTSTVLLEVYSSGNIDLHGGAATTGTSGDGGSLKIASNNTLHVSGTIDAHSGAGTTGGGQGGSVQLSAGSYGTGGLLSNSTITTTGGSCNSAACNAGDGGNVAFQGVAGDLVSSGAITLDGGSGGTTGNGADAGTVTFVTEGVGENAVGIADVPTGSVHISGNISAKGGAGVEGGRGGEVVGVLEGQIPNGEEIIFEGYKSFTANGGASTGGTGGTGGIFEAGQLNGSNNGVATPGGPIYAAVAWTANGGAGVTGGAGGNFLIIDEYFSGTYFANDPSNIETHGTFTMTGGAGTTGTATSSSGGNGGSFSIAGSANVTNDATVTLTGGAATGAMSSGGNASTGFFFSDGAVQLTSVYGTIDNSGTFNFSGGAGGDFGGNAGTLLFDASNVTNSAALTGTGGNGGMAVGDTGGNGGAVTMTSSAGATVNTGTSTLTAGTGTTPGTTGTVSIDGVTQ